ncbi:nuclear transport factor 2 family protein [Brevibacterium sp. UCMA 11754]|uniref:nuclear transport factor 2 family protein n=1 Tax=Brevibacterium sp. UCMA 11754 TaxID=2749198 RepID=UPI001F43E903|nr:nuclear transport factor 2 family protein [Brevibacterium sp. UCMA 11754]MCF2570741.1 nuclear transport factor 2 family protein [Brevibacterium sp. UCMA 11754]
MSDLQIPEPVAGFIDTVNAHDAQGFLDAFTADGTVDDWGREFTGRDAIKAWSDKEFIGATGVLTPEEVSNDGDEVTVIGDWRSTHANGRSSFTFAVDGDKLSRMTIREG